MEISRKTEFVLGLIGGILGSLTAIMVMTVGGAASLFAAEGAGSVTTIGFIALLFSILGLVGACMVKKYHLLGGTFMVAAAIGGTISTAFFYSVPLVLFAIAGLMALIRGGEFTKIFKLWWFYTLVVVAFVVPIIGVASIASSVSASNSAESSDHTDSSDSGSTTSMVDESSNYDDTADSSQDSTDSITTEEKQDPTDQSETPKESKEEVPADYQSALNQAESYSEMMHMSKAGIYDQLTSEYGGQFSNEAAQYAIDNIQVDWNANALEMAKSYQETMSMSPEAIRDQLTSEYGEQFTQEEADYAVQHLND
ncbi:Ltp family lipoprotein [Listeria ilorinensis]|uniref:Ltp family lipoprotein n=1 Tax=Listeria ilorinensis TaxID=2867439 RepID=UPI001EF6E717|nr:Ltp family lipoprotein [Listeria ilorinensis]